MEEGKKGREGGRMGTGGRIRRVAGVWGGGK